MGGRPASWGMHGAQQAVIRWEDALDAIYGSGDTRRLANAVSSYYRGCFLRTQTATRITNKWVKLIHNSLHTLLEVHMKNLNLS